MERIPFNRCNLPPWVIASREFNEDPRPLELQGVAHANRFLFETLDRLEDPAARAKTFDDWLSVRFQLHQWEAQETPTARRSLRNSYLRFLRGWGHDSNAVEGAVLKGWVESRIGLPPTYHREPLGDIHSEAYFRYSLDRMKGHERTSAVCAQLDVLFEFVQHELGRRGAGHETLYRGVHDLAEHEILQELGQGRLLLRLNNLNSFTWDFERAWEFGSRVLETRVPTPKIFFRSDLLPVPVLQGEQEVLVVGGEYEVAVKRW